MSGTMFEPVLLPNFSRPVLYAPDIDRPGSPRLTPLDNVWSMDSSFSLFGKRLFPAGPSRSVCFRYAIDTPADRVGRVSLSLCSMPNADHRIWPTGSVSDLWIDPRHRRMGIGTASVLSLVRSINSDLSALVHADDPSVPFWERFGPRTGPDGNGMLEFHISRNGTPCRNPGPHVSSPPRHGQPLLHPRKPEAREGGTFGMEEVRQTIRLLNGLNGLTD